MLLGFSVRDRNGLYCHALLLLCCRSKRPCGRSELCGHHASAFEMNRSKPRLCERNFAASCPFTLFPAPSSRGANVPKPPLPGETATIPPPTPLLPGSPIS